MADQYQCPGGKDQVTYQELSTPLSNLWFAQHPEGLYLTGVDAGTLGIAGALFGGALSSLCLLGPRKMGPVLKLLR